LLAAGAVINKITFLVFRVAGQPEYIVTDGDLPCTTYVEQNYTYYFNICGTVTSYPQACATLPGLGSTAALQVDERATQDPTDDWCYNVGLFDLNTKQELLDQEDPTKGVALTYYGDYCGNHKRREFRIELSCADNLNAVPQHALETSGCQYTVNIPSVYGCPTECPVGGKARSVCGSNGFCGFDIDANSARCFCNTGYGGADCSTETEAASLNYSPVMLGLIITIFIIIFILVGSIILMVRQLSAYKDDLRNYQVRRCFDLILSFSVVDFLCACRC
jgi:hypothetical protein